MIFSPVANLMHHPLGGKCFETACKKCLLFKKKVLELQAGRYLYAWGITCTMYIVVLYNFGVGNQSDGKQASCALCRAYQEDLGTYHTGQQTYGA